MHSFDIKDLSHADRVQFCADLIQKFGESQCPEGHELIGAKATVILPVVANDRVPRGIVWIPFNQHGGHAEDLIDASASITDVRIELV